MDIQSELDRIKSFVDCGNHHAAMNLAISALNESRRNDDQNGIDTFLRLINKISITMMHEFGSQDCIDEINKWRYRGYFWVTYTLTATSKGQEKMIRDDSKSLFILRRQVNTSWKIAGLMDNSNRSQPR